MAQALIIIAQLLTGNHLAIAQQRYIIITRQLHRHAYLLLTEKKAAIRVTPAVTVVCGLLAGVCGGLFSIGGPIMAIYYLAATDSRESYLANAQANFAVNNVTSITTRVLSGYYTLDLLPLTLLGVAGVVCGQRFGLKLGGKLNAVQLRRLVYAYIILSGAVTVVQHL